MIVELFAIGLVLAATGLALAHAVRERKPRRVPVEMRRRRTSPGAGQ